MVELVDQPHIYAPGSWQDQSNWALLFLAAYLKDDEVAVLMEVGSEKLRYLCGFATAVNSKGETVSISLEHIYELARKLGPNITPAQY